MLVLVQWAQQTDEEILGMSFSVTSIISVLHRVMKAALVTAWMVRKERNNLYCKSNRLYLEIQLLNIYYDLYFRGLPRH